MKPIKTLIVITLILFGALLVAGLLYLLQPEPVTTEPERPVPVLEVVSVQPQDVSWWLPSQGTVEARTRTVLAAEVSGRVIEVSDAFENGGRIEKGDVLVRIDSADYEAALASARANLAEAELSLAQEEASAQQARRDWEKLGRGEAKPLTLRKPQLERARAVVESARAAVAKAERDLERTRITAPYDGRVVETYVDIGQYVGGMGAELARIYASDVLEVRLPLQARDYALIEHPESDAEQIPVKLSARAGNERYEWDAWLDRSEATVNAQSRLRHVVARIPENAQHGEARLLPGTFVEARLRSKPLHQVFIVPRAALVDRETVLTVGKRQLKDSSEQEDILQRRTVRVRFADETRAIIDQGLDGQERVVVTPLEYIVEGMKVDPLVIPFENALEQASGLSAEGERMFGVESLDQDGEVAP